MSSSCFGFSDFDSLGLFWESISKRCNFCNVIPGQELRTKWFDSENRRNSKVLANKWASKSYTDYIVCFVCDRCDTVLHAKTVIFFFASLLPYKMHTRQQDIDLAGVPSSIPGPKSLVSMAIPAELLTGGVPLSFTNCLFYHENASYIQTKQPGEKVTKLSSLSIKSFSCVRVHLSSNNQSGIMQLIQFLRNYEAIKLLLTNSTSS